MWTTSEEDEAERCAGEVIEVLSRAPVAGDLHRVNALLFPHNTANVAPSSLPLPPHPPEAPSALPSYVRSAMSKLARLRLGQSGNTVLHVAARQGRADLLPLLLPLMSCPTLVSQPNLNGDTRASPPPCSFDTIPNPTQPKALMFGAMGGHADVVDCLLASGASPAATNRTGAQP